MSRSHLRTIHPKYIRDTVDVVVVLSDEMHQREEMLIQKLKLIDEKRFYVRFGYKSLRSFCQKSLRFTETQSQRIVTQVRRYEPTPQIGQKRGGSSLEKQGSENTEALENR